MNLEITKIVEEDIPALTRTMTRAFDDDAKKYLGKDKGGPPGYDNGDFFRKWLFLYDECEGYKLVADGQIVGGMLVWIAKDNNNTWGNVFVDPLWQNKGLGTRAWQFIEKHYPVARSWTLETPGYSIGNHKFYEKLGFEKIREEDAPDHPGKSFIYRKMMVKKTDE